MGQRTDGGCRWCESESVEGEQVERERRGMNVAWVITFELRDMNLNLSISAAF